MSYALYVRIPDHLAEDLKTMATESGTSLSAVTARIIARGLGYVADPIEESRQRLITRRKEPFRDDQR